ncbi:MAG: hypothetical protein HY475_01560 [Candidatus Terrybacteria bacterium]|nr:hypothetical protein [Candidatus Terrybacteria bacterium]
MFAWVLLAAYCCVGLIVVCDRWRALARAFDWRWNPMDRFFLFSFGSIIATVAGAVWPFVLVGLYISWRSDRALARKYGRPPQRFGLGLP